MGIRRRSIAAAALAAVTAAVTTLAMSGSAPAVQAVPAAQVQQVQQQAKAAAGLVADETERLAAARLTLANCQMQASVSSGEQLKRQLDCIADQQAILDPTPPTKYPERWSVGAPGVKRYAYADKKLPVPPGYEVLTGDVNNELTESSCSGLNLDHKYIRGYIYFGTACTGNVHITNSIIVPPPGAVHQAIMMNSSGVLNLTVEDTTIRPEPKATSLDGSEQIALLLNAFTNCDLCTLTLKRLDVSHTGGLCVCGSIDAERVWLHDSTVADTNPDLAHTGVMFPYGGVGSGWHAKAVRFEPGVDAVTGFEIPNYWQPCTATLFTQGGTYSNYILEDSFIGRCGYAAWWQAGVGITVRNNVFDLGGHFGGVLKESGVTFAAWTNNFQGAISGAQSGILVPAP